MTHLYASDRSLNKLAQRYVLNEHFVEGSPSNLPVISKTHFTALFVSSRSNLSLIYTQKDAPLALKWLFLHSFFSSVKGCRRLGLKEKNVHQYFTINGTSPSGFIKNSFMFKNLVNFMGYVIINLFWLAETRRNKAFPLCALSMLVMHTCFTCPSSAFTNTCSLYKNEHYTLFIKIVRNSNSESSPVRSNPLTWMSLSSKRVY